MIIVKFESQERGILKILTLLRKHDILAWTAWYVLGSKVIHTYLFIHIAICFGLTNQSWICFRKLCLDGQDLTEIVGRHSPLFHLELTRVVVTTILFWLAYKLQGPFKGALTEVVMTLHPLGAYIAHRARSQCSVETLVPRLSPTLV